MAEYCGHCAHLDPKQRNNYSSRIEYKCNDGNGYHKVTAKSCNSFVKDPQKYKQYNSVCAMCGWLDLKQVDNYFSDNSYCCDGGHGYQKPLYKACSDFILEPSRIDCYITTSICKTLGFENYSGILVTLRNFHKYLKKDPKYVSLILQYDEIGPILSVELENAQDNYELALELMENFLYPCVTAINCNNCDEAIETYKNMVMYLKGKLISSNIGVSANINNNSETLGKERYRLRNAQ